MVSLESLQATSKSLEPCSSPARISFSSDFLDENNFISIHPNPPETEKKQNNKPKTARNAPDQFEFLSGDLTNMITADELFCEGKLLPFWQMHHAAEKLNKITLKPENGTTTKNQQMEKKDKEDSRISWFLDEDPSPRPPKCTVLWKELLRLRKQRPPSTLLPSSSSSSSSSSRSSAPEISPDDQKKIGIGNREKAVKRIKKGLERTRSASIRIRPVINVPICSHTKSSTASASMPPLFSLKKGRLVKHYKGDNNNSNVEK